MTELRSLAAPRAAAVVVVGLMGAGKSTVGGLLARALGCPIDDSDASIEAREGRTVRQLRDDLGTDDMHALEVRHLMEALAAPRPRVITPAAFTVEVEACRAALSQPDVAVVWLRATPATLAARFRAGSHRPSYGADPEQFLAEQSARRTPLFLALDPVVVDVEMASPAMAADQALTGLDRRWRDPGDGRADGSAADRTGSERP